MASKQTVYYTLLNIIIINISVGILVKNSFQECEFPSDHA